MSDWGDKFKKEDKNKPSLLDDPDNDYPLSDIDYMRVGSAYVMVERKDKEALQELLAKYATNINTFYNPESEGKNDILVVAPKNPAKKKKPVVPEIPDDEEDDE